MGLATARIETVAEGDAALTEATEPASALVVPVHTVVPAWLPSIVERAHAAGATVTVSAEPAADLDGEALDGWEIGLCTAALAMGVDHLVGVSPKRVRRVEAVLRAIDGAGRAEEAMS